MQGNDREGVIERRGRRGEGEASVLAEECGPASDRALGNLGNTGQWACPLS